MTEKGCCCGEAIPTTWYLLSTWSSIVRANQAGSISILCHTKWLLRPRFLTKLVLVHWWCVFDIDSCSSQGRGMGNGVQWQARHVEREPRGEERDEWGLLWLPTRTKVPRGKCYRYNTRNKQIVCTAQSLCACLGLPLACRLVVWLCFDFCTRSSCCHVPAACSGGHAGTVGRLVKSWQEGILVGGKFSCEP